MELAASAAVCGLVGAVLGRSAALPRPRDLIGLLIGVIVWMLIQVIPATGGDVGAATAVAVAGGRSPDGPAPMLAIMATQVIPLLAAALALGAYLAGLQSARPTPRPRWRWAARLPGLAFPALAFLLVWRVPPAIAGPLGVHLLMGVVAGLLLGGFVQGTLRSPLRSAPRLPVLALAALLGSAALLLMPRGVLDLVASVVSAVLGVFVAGYLIELASARPRTDGRVPLGVAVLVGVALAFGVSRLPL